MKIARICVRSTAPSATLAGPASSTEKPAALAHDVAPRPITSARATAAPSTGIGSWLFSATGSPGTSTRLVMTPSAGSRVAASDAWTVRGRSAASAASKRSPPTWTVALTGLDASRRARTNTWPPQPHRATTHNRSIGPIDPNGQRKNRPGRADRPILALAPLFHYPFAQSLDREFPLFQYLPIRMLGVHVLAAA